MKAFTTAFFCHRKTNIERHLRHRRVPCLLSQFPLTFHQIHNGMPIAYNYFRADWDGLRDHFRDVPWEDIFKLGASAAASELCEWVQIGIDVYIPRKKYQVKHHSSR